VVGETAVTCGAASGSPAETVRSADPDLFSDVAVIVAEPGVIAVTMPALDTVAICVLLDTQELARPSRTLLLASRATAVA
jgi:hypothetical protein